MLKRSCDVVLASIGLVLLSPLFLLLAVLIKLESPGPVFFRQTRVGRGFRTFTLFKFRTMRVLSQEKCDAANGIDGKAQFFECERITRFGALLRQAKVDEIPQLWNVLRGEMSLVGPRPLVEWQVDSMRDEYATILRVRPGMTDLASIRFRKESEILNTVEDPIEYYLSIIMPEKISLQREYIERQSLKFDFWIIWCTALICLGSTRARRRIEVAVARKMYRRHVAASRTNSMKPTADGEFSSVGD